MHAVGLAGFLNWAAIPNQGALGAGLWLFTLLLIYYLAYPYLVRAALTKWHQVLC